MLLNFIRGERIKQEINLIKEDDNDIILLFLLICIFFSQIWKPDFWFFSVSELKHTILKYNFPTKKKIAADIDFNSVDKDHQ